MSYTPAQQPSPRPHPGTPLPAPRRPWWKAVWVVGLAAMIVGIVIGSASSSAAKDEPKATPTMSVTATATVSTTDTTTATATVRRTVTATPTIVRTVATHTHTRTVTYTPPPKPAITDGTYKVGTDIKSGEWRTNGNGMCYWEVDQDLGGGIDSILNNDNIEGSAIVDLSDGQYFKTSGGCEWRRS